MAGGRLRAPRTERRRSARGLRGVPARGRLARRCAGGAAAPRAATPVGPERAGRSGVRTQRAGRVKGWRANCRVRWRFRRFRSGPQSGSHGHVSSPCSPNPACRFPAPGSPVGSCASHTDRLCESDTQAVGLSRHDLRMRHSFRPACPPRLRRAAEPVHASATSNHSGSTPSLMHVMLPESLPSTRGPGIATPASLLPSDIAPHLRPLSSTGITRRFQSYGPLRHPDRPGLPLAGVRLARATPPTGLPVLRPSPPSMRAAATTPADPVGALIARFPADGSLPRFTAGSASALPVSRPAQRSLSLRPAWSLSHPR